MNARTRVLVIVLLGWLAVASPSLAATGADEVPDLSSGWELRSSGLTGDWGGVVAGTPTFGYVVFGTRPGGDGLFSLDGLTWDPIALPEATGTVNVIDVAANEDGFVAVARPMSVSAGREYPPWIWHSEDGLSWIRIAAEALPLPTLTNGAFEQVTANETGFAVVVVDDCPVVVWFSENGRDWSASNMQAGCWAVELAATRRGWVALTGRGGSATEVLTSADGLSWEVVDALDDSVRPADTVAAPPVDFLAGRFASRQSFVASDSALVFSRGRSVWASVDFGRSWTQTSFTGGPDRELFPMIDSAVGFVGSHDVGPAIVSSPDGLAWTEHPTTVLLSDLAPAGDSIIAVDHDGNVYTWTSPTPQTLPTTGTDPTVLVLFGFGLLATGRVLFSAGKPSSITTGHGES